MTDGTSHGSSNRRLCGSEGRWRLSAAAGTCALYSVVLAVCGLIRYGWTTEWFWSSGSQAITFLLLGAGSLAAKGFAYRGKVAERLEPDTHDRLLADRSDAIAAKITFIICINLCINMFTIASVFGVEPLQYLAWGLALACMLYVVVSIVAKAQYRKTLEKP
ncbi:hypothetical protein JS533_006190 [Bifidobacterium amazonense]|uniref:Uncharacterized protein n=3 Tax=Bifidobacterium TaxID=1678 RepID=A0ABS9VV91_9BIFI|nr:MULTISPECIES: hypothetical protein [Bifidobacterium]MBT1173323.1 hypothetical protein [Bifidobacterium santillanense]MBT1174086.1 hypothetical protein [Bifidobacterium colobi]MCH9275861.1 hypothetical protein [Bifidobacterium amazonense]